MSQSRDEQWMRRAIDVARRGIDAGQTPFGAVIVRGEECIAEAHNEVWATFDPTAHAEVQAIRAACEALDTIDLSDCDIYATTEPCPMCFAAIHWARLGRIVYGATIADADEAGFNEMHLSNQDMHRLAGLKSELVSGVLSEECAALFAEWQAAGKSKTY